MQLSGKVVEQAGRGEQSEYSVDHRGSDTVIACGAHHLCRVSRPIKEGYDRRGPAEPGQRAGPPGINADLESVAAPPYRP